MINNKIDDSKDRASKNYIGVRLWNLVICLVLIHQIGGGFLSDALGDEELGQNNYISSSFSSSYIN